jgi:hypothetical protein
VKQLAAQLDENKLKNSGKSDSTKPKKKLIIHNIIVFIIKFKIFEF